MGTFVGLALFALYLALAPVLFRLLRSPQRPAWPRRGLNAEFLMLAHIALLVAAGVTLAQALVG